MVLLFTSPNTYLRRTIIHIRNNSSNARFEAKLEALRSFAAIIVLICHALYLTFSLDPKYLPSKIWAKLFPGHSCVLLFFILSGYVIGLTNKYGIQKKGILLYLKKRFVRLYPVYLVSLMLSLFVAGAKYPFTTILGHFLFLQNSVVPVVYENNPLWSLNSEVVYYLLFIPISYFSLSPSKVFFGALIAGLLSCIFLHVPTLSNLSFGFVFWTAGLWAAQSQRLERQETSKYLLFALLFLFIGYQELNPFIAVLAAVEGKLHILLSDALGPVVTLNDLAQLPLCLYIILKFTDKKVPLEKILLSGIFVLSWVFFLYSLNKHGIRSTVVEYKLLPVTCLVVGTVLLIMAYFLPAAKNSVALPNVAIKLGAISYAIYAIHFPVSLLLAKIPFFSGTLFTFCVRLAIDFAIVLFFSYLLEKRFQPWIKLKMS